MARLTIFISFLLHNFLLQQLDYLSFIDAYHERIKMFHVKDAEFNPTAKQGVYGGYQSWVERAGRFRSLGDGQVDFKAIFSQFAKYGYSGWAVLEWECALKHPEDGAAVRTGHAGQVSGGILAGRPGAVRLGTRTQRHFTQPAFRGRPDAPGRAGAGTGQRRGLCRSARCGKGA